MEAGSATESAEPRVSRKKDDDGTFFDHFRIYLTIAIHAVLGPWGYALFWFIRLLPVPRARRQAWLQAAIRTGFRTTRSWLELIGAVTFRTPPLGGGNLPPACVLVANHPSHMDILATLSWVPRCVTIVKPSIWRMWWLEPLMRGSGQLEGASHPLGVGRLIDRAVARLHRRQRIIVFPEGTRTEAGREMAFHRLAFEIACQASVPIVPLRITCLPPFLSKGRSVLHPPRARPEVTVEVLDPVTPESVGGCSRALRDRVHAAIMGGARTKQSVRT